VTQASLDTCVVCGTKAASAQPILAVARTPMHPFRPPRESGSAAGFGRLEIVQCGGCGHIYNAGFDPDGADDLYGAFVLTNTPVSDSMVANVRETANVILGKAVENPAVLEIGGGAGALSLALSERAREVHLVEPSKALSADRFDGTRVTYHRSMYPNAALTGRVFDVVVCRQVLEHVPFPEGFLRELRGALRDYGIAYIEIPCAEYIVDNLSIVDFHYPHVHYYRQAEIDTLFRRAGFAVAETVSVKDGHDIGFFVRPITPVPDLSYGGHGLRAFGAEVAVHHAIGLQRLCELAGGVALYGANAYSQAFFGLYPDFAVAAVFDDTPLYMGHRAYGQTQDLPIGPPSVEALGDIGAVIVTAYLHDIAIAAKLRRLGYAGAIFTVRSDPSAGQGGRPPSLFL
jgi:SAM-dependent methyltransferase